ncbi:N-acetyltransferase GCN5, partial [Microdochium trichocladiopsis]
PLGPPVADPSPARSPDRGTVLEGKYVALEPLDADKHAAGLYAALCEYPARIASSAGNAYLPVGPFASREEFTRQMQAYSPSRDPFFYAVVTRRDIVTQDNGSATPTTAIKTPAGSPVGWLSLLNVETAHQSLEVGHVAFSPVLQRTVASTEALYLVIRHAFEALGNRRVEWKCDVLNAPSRRAAERLGMSFEGVFRKHRIVRGRNRDTRWYSVVDDEWFGRVGDGEGRGRGGLRAGFEEWLRDDNFGEDGVQKRTLEQVR